MEMRKDGAEGQATARSAAKSSGGKKQTREQASNSTGQEGQQEGLVQHAKEAGGEIVNQVQQQAGSQLNRGKETAASELSQVANAVRRLRENLGEESGPLVRYVAEYGDKAADGLERLGNYIREQDPKQLLNNVQNFGRRRPALLLGGAFLLGFAGARLIKSSMEAGSQQQWSERNIEAPPYDTNLPARRPPRVPNTL